MSSTGPSALHGGGLRHIRLLHRAVEFRGSVAGGTPAVQSVRAVAAAVGSLNATGGRSQRKLEIPNPKLQTNRKSHNPKTGPERLGLELLQRL